MSVNFANKYISQAVGIFNMLQKLVAWDHRLYFPSKESLATDFLSPSKIHCPLSGLNPRILGSVANMITTDSDYLI
jgi:hypothetical protein